MKRNRKGGKISAAKRLPRNSLIPIYENQEGERGWPARVGGRFMDAWPRERHVSEKSSRLYRRPESLSGFAAGEGWRKSPARIFHPHSRAPLIQRECQGLNSLPSGNPSAALVLVGRDALKALFCAAFLPEVARRDRGIESGTAERVRARCVSAFSGRATLRSRAREFIVSVAVKRISDRAAAI